MGLDDAMAGSVSEAADLAAMLPPGSRTMAALDPAMAWPEELTVLVRACNLLAALDWRASGCRGTPPAPIMHPSQSARDEGPEVVAMDSSDLMAALAGPREEI